jgi:HK97 family phage portal protein
VILDRLFESRMTSLSGGTLQEPARTLFESLGIAPSATGVSVTETTAEGIPAVYATVKVITETVGQTSLKVFQKLARGNKTPDEAHPLYTLLHDLANPELIASEFRETLTGHACLWGNGYAEIERRKSGTVKALWPLHPGFMTVDRGNDNRQRYTYKKPGVAEPVVYHWDPATPPIFHLRYNGGRSPIRVMRESFATTRALEIYLATLFGNGARPGGVLSSKEPVKITQAQIDTIRRQWEELHRGVGNAHKVAILPGGLQWQSVGMPPEDAQFAELMKFQVEQCARIWRVPLFMIQSTEKSTSWGTGIEQMGIGFTNFTMLPWFIRWQQTIGRDLLTYKSFETHEALFNVAALMRGDMAAVNAALQVQRQNGIISANEWRELVDMNEQTGDQGNQYWRPMNYVPADTPVADPTAVPPAPDPAIADGRARVEALETRLADVAGARQPIEMHAAPVTVTSPAVHVDVHLPGPVPTRRSYTRDPANGLVTETLETPVKDAP